MIGRFLAVALTMLLAACASTATIKTDYDPQAASVQAALDKLFAGFRPGGASAR